MADHDRANFNIVKFIESIFDHTAGRSQRYLAVLSTKDCGLVAEIKTTATALRREKWFK